MGVSVVRDVTQPTWSCCGAWCLTFLGSAQAACATLALALALSHVSVEPAAGQTADRPSISVARAIAAQPSTQVAFPIRVGKAPRDSFARVRGLPPTATLSQGHSIAPGAWAVPLNALSDLTIAVPAMAAGSTDVSVTLVGPDGLVLAEAKSTLVIAPPPPSPPSTPYDRQRAVQFLQKGNEQLSQGLVAPARQFYERAADLGLAEAALAMAATYDPVELGRLGLRGIQPDANEARRWYERARALGAEQAEQRLQRLNGM